LPSAVVDSDFDRFIADVWPNGEAPLKAAVILWNCWVSFSGSGLTPRDIAAFRAPPIELFLARLPHRFSDLFTNDMFGTQLRSSTADSGSDIAYCLKCSGLLVVDMSQVNLLFEHNQDCGIMLIMVITGGLATALLTINHLEATLTLLPPLYVTEGGDESIGLSLAMPLILSEERCPFWCV
jgi:hypothetical protein